MPGRIRYQAKGLRKRRQRTKSGFPLGLHPVSLAKIKEMGWNVGAATSVVANVNAREGEDALPYKFFCNG